MFDLELCGKNAKIASRALNNLCEDKINAVLKKSAELIRANINLLKQENEKDVLLARKNGATEAYVDRLTLTDKVINDMAEGIEQVAMLKSPVGLVEYSYFNQKQGISVEKKKVPFGVIGIIYESRPNVTADAFALCFKTSNAVILKGGSDSLNSNVAIANVIRQALKIEGVDQNAITVIQDTSRETTLKFMQLNKYVDLLIPRGGASLINSALQNATIPIIETGKGNCHIYVDEYADLDKAVKIIFNAKTQRYSVCNACESLVIHANILDKALPLIAKELEKKCVQIRCDERAYQTIKDYKYVSRASEEDFYTEYGGAVISVKTVDNIDQAITHVNEHSTYHSEAIVTECDKNAQLFMAQIDSSCVYHNASTRFSDGFVFGLGAEIGISTQKLHARGPMGLGALVTTKYYVKGNGSVRV